MTKFCASVATEAPMVTSATEGPIHGWARGYSWLSWCLIGLLALLPVATMARGGSAGVVYYLLILASLLFLVCASKVSRATLAASFSALRVVFGAGVVFLLVFLALDFFHHGKPGSGFEKSIRFFLLVPLAVALAQIDLGRLKYVQIGILLASAVTAVALIFPPAVMLDGRPDTVQFSRLNTVEFGNLTALYAMLTLLCAFWPLTRFVAVERWLKILLAAITCYGFFLSQTRTGWLALPLFAAIFLLLRSRRPKVFLLSILVFVCVASAAVLGSASMRDRFALAGNELNHCISNPLQESSICMRVQLLRASWDMFEENPLFGVGGGDTFREALRQSSEKGVVSGFVAQNFGEPHNDFFFYLANYGLLGFFAALAFIYVAPLWLFCKGFWRDARLAIRLPAAMGIALCGGFVFFGMSEMMFRNMRMASLYSALLAFFLAAMVSGLLALARSGTSHESAGHPAAPLYPRPTTS